MTRSPAKESTVDSHHHFWREGESHQPWRLPEHDVLVRDFLPADMRPQMDAAGVRHSVLVQSVNTADENTRMLRFAEEAGTVAGIVGWLPLEDPAGAEEMLPAFVAEPRMRGVQFSWSPR